MFLDKDGGEMVWRNRGREGMVDEKWKGSREEDREGGKGKK